MSASARGTAAKPGRRVKQKAALNRRILDAGWALFRTQLKYKCVGLGGALVTVNAAYTSQTCSSCGHVDADNRKSQAHFACVACGHTEHADVNVAKNILAAGHAVWQAGLQARPAAACGGAVRRASVARSKRAAPSKQEPTEGLARA